MPKSKTLSLLLAVVCCAYSQNTAIFDNPKRPFMTANRPAALALIGDRYHSPGYIREGLAKALADENIPVTFIENVAELNAGSLAGRQLLIILRDGMNWPNGYDKEHVKWMTDAQQLAIWEFVNRGGGVLALHNSQGLYPPGGLYYKMFGGDYGGHPKPYVFTVRVENKRHPITAGVEDFEIFDEQHTVKYYLDDEHWLLRTIAPDNLAAAGGWWRELGTGRFCYLSPGHTREALNHPMMQRLIRNAVNWVLQQN